MEHALVCASVWLLICLLIPFQRLKALAPALSVSLLWMLFIDNAAYYLGYYQYLNCLVPMGHASLLQLLAVSGVGILMLNWLTPHPKSKLLSIFVTASAFSVLQYIYTRSDAFQLMRLDVILCYVFHLAALSVFMWLSLIFVGERVIHAPHRMRSLMKHQRAQMREGAV